MRGLAALGLIAAIAASPFAGAALAPVAQFDVRLDTDRGKATIATGRLHVPDLVGFTAGLAPIAQADGGAPLLTGELVRFVLNEYRRPMPLEGKSQDLDNPFFQTKKDPTTILAEHTRTEIMSRNARLYVEKFQTRSAWSVGSQPGTVSGLEQAGSCSITPAPGRARTVYAPDQDLAFVQSTCQTESLRASGSLQGGFQGSTFRLIDDERNMLIETGSKREPNRTAAGAFYDQIHRTLRFDVLTLPGAFELPAKMNLTMRTPIMTWVGSLQVPATPNGTLTWDTWTQDGALPSLQPEGQLQFRAYNETRLHIFGTTTNAPAESIPMPTPPDSAAPTAVVLGVIVASLVGLHWRRLLSPLVSLFSRITQSTALDHPKRRAIVEFVRLNPAVGIQDVARHFHIDYRTALHHVQVLCAQNIVVCRRFGPQTALFSKEEVSWDQMPALFRLRQPGVRGIVETILKHPDGSQEEIAQATQTTQQNVSRVVRQLLKEGILVAHKRGRRTLYAVAGGYQTIAPG